MHSPPAREVAVATRGTDDHRENYMEIDMRALRHLLTSRRDEIEASVAGTGYLPKTVTGVGTFLLDNEGNIDLLTAKQRAVFDKFLLPLLEKGRR